MNRYIPKIRFSLRQLILATIFLGLILGCLIYVYGQYQSDSIRLKRETATNALLDRTQRAFFEAWSSYCKQTSRIIGGPDRTFNKTKVSYRLDKFLNISGSSKDEWQHKLLVHVEVNVLFGDMSPSLLIEKKDGCETDKFLDVLRKYLDRESIPYEIH